MDASAVPSPAQSPAPAPIIVVTPRRISFVDDFGWEKDGFRVARQANDGIQTLIRRERIRIALGNTLLAVPVVWVIQHALSTDTPYVDGTAWAVAIVLGVGLVSLGVHRGGTWAKFARECDADCEKAPSFGTVDMEITNDGLRFHGPTGHVGYAWMMFERVVRNEKHIILLWADSCGGFAVPRAAFSSSAEANAFADQIDAALRATGFSLEQRVEKSLANRSLPCGDCGHDLKGLRSPKCPECGRQLSSGTLRLFEQMARRDWWYRR